MRINKNKLNDIVITYRHSYENEPKLRQLLRKIENEIEGYREIAIVGDVPDFLQGVIEIPQNYEKDIRWKHKYNLRLLHRACMCSDITTNFLWMTQDAVLTKVDARKACRIKSAIKPKGHDKITMHHTNDILERRGFRYDNYFSEYPMSFSKINLNNTFSIVDFDTMFGYCIKTLYANFNRLKPANQTEPLDNEEYHGLSSYEKF